MKRLPSSDNKDPIEKRLGHWCNTRKNDYRVKRPSLTPEKIKKLEKIPQWSWAKSKDDVMQKTFEESYKSLKEFVNENNSMPKKTSQNKIEKYLYGWSQRQKNAYRNKKNCLTSDKIRKLEKIIG